MKQLFQTAFILTAALLSRNATAQFTQVNLVTDDQSAYPAIITDPDLKNAWGVSYTPTSPFWVSDNETGKATLYSVNPTTDVPVKQPLTVTIPGLGNVTGQAFNSFAAGGAFNGNAFLFVSEDGTISGWRGALGTTAEVLQVGGADNVFKGSEFAKVGDHGYLYAANFKQGTIDIVKGDVGAPSLTGNFTDPGLPAGYAPFNIRNLNGTLYVAYALQGADKSEEEKGLGLGIVSAFDLQGNFLGRIGTAGTLNAPWGLAIAPASFGPLAGDLLVGNFGDGTINAFKIGGPPTPDGQVLGTDGNPLEIEGLWALTVGNGGNGGSTDKVYFSAGPDDEEHGLFGLLALPDGGSTLTLLAGGFGLLAIGRKRTVA
jgi:uncharacterized protein (TIGR03118 family)